MRLITVPVALSFDHAEPIGFLTVDADSLPKDPDFCFSIAFKGTTRFAPGEIPTEPPTGRYELVAVAVTSDQSYAGYLKQIGVEAI